MISLMRRTVLTVSYDCKLSPLKQELDNTAWSSKAVRYKKKYVTTKTTLLDLRELRPG